MRVAADSTSAQAPASPSAASETAHWVLFGLDEGRYALPLAVVDRIVRATQITPIPLAPALVLGAIDVAGEIFPVLNVRGRFGLPERPVHTGDQFLIARTARRGVVLHIDAAFGVLERPLSAIVASTSLAPDLAQIQGVIQLEDGLLLIQDLEKFLSPQEERALDRALIAKETSYAP